MKIILCIVVLLFAVSTSLAGIVLSSLYRNDESGTCDIDADYKVPVGVYKNKRVECGLIICYDNLDVRFFSCATTELHLSGYKFGDYVDKGLIYPVCCDRKIVPVNPKP